MTTKSFSKNKAEKGGKALSATTVTPVTADIVPGKLTENDWLQLVEREDSSEFISEIVNEIYQAADSIIFERYIARQVVPFTVWKAKDDLLQIIEWNFLARDEGLLSDAVIDWSQDDEPLTTVIDCWAQGSVPRQVSTACLSDKKKSSVEESPGARSPNESAIGGEVRDLPYIIPASPLLQNVNEGKEDEEEEEEEETVQQQPIESQQVSERTDPVSDEANGEGGVRNTIASDDERTDTRETVVERNTTDILHTVVSSQEGEPGALKTIVLYDGRQENQDEQTEKENDVTPAVSASIVALKASSRRCFAEYILDRDDGSVQGSVRLLEKCPFLSLSNEKDAGLNQCVPNPAIKRIPAHRLPSNRVEPTFVVENPPSNVSVKQPLGRTAARKSAPARISVAVPTGNAKDYNDSSRTQLLPQSFFDSMVVSSGVTVRELDRVKQGPKLVPTQKESVTKALDRRLQPIRMQHVVEDIDLSDLLDHSVPVIKPLCAISPVPPISQRTSSSVS